MQAVTILEGTPAPALIAEPVKKETLFKKIKQSAKPNARSNGRS